MTSLSPKRQLEALFGYKPTSSRSTASSWMKFSCGDTVREKDGRHLGRVMEIKWSYIVVVQWHDTGWISEFNLHLGELEKVRD